MLDILLKVIYLISPLACFSSEKFWNIMKSYILVVSPIDLGVETPFLVFPLLIAL